MKIKFLRSWGLINKGSILDVDPPVAEQYVARKCAEYVNTENKTKECVKCCGRKAGRPRKG